MIRHAHNLVPYVGPSRPALVDSIEADRRSAERATTPERRTYYARMVAMGEDALRRFDEMAQKAPASGVVRRSTLLGVAPPAPGSSPTPRVAEYSFVALRSPRAPFANSPDSARREIYRERAAARGRASR